MNGTKRVTTGRVGRFVPALRTWFAKRREHRGQALVELALILPIMLVLFSSALDLGRLYYSQITIENAAKEGALEAAKNPTSFDATSDCDAVTNRVICLVVHEAKGSLISIQPSDVSLACKPGPCGAPPAIGHTVEVTVGGTFQLISPVLSVFFGGQGFPISATSVAQLRVQPQPGGIPTPTPAPTATPTPTPAPTPTPTPDPLATPTPEPTPTPVCLTPTVVGDITVTPGSGESVLTGTGTEFTATAPTVVDQPGCTFVYSWSWGDGASGSTATATHQYQKKGTGKDKDYTITLSISTLGVPVTWIGTESVVVDP